MVQEVRINHRIVALPIECRYSALILYPMDVDKLNNNNKQQQKYSLPFRHELIEKQMKRKTEKEKKKH